MTERGKDREIGRERAKATTPERENRCEVACTTTLEHIRAAPQWSARRGSRKVFVEPPAQRNPEGGHPG